MLTELAQPSIASRVDWEPTPRILEILAEPRTAQRPSTNNAMHYLVERNARGEERPSRLIDQQSQVNVEEH